MNLGPSVDRGSIARIGVDKEFGSHDTAVRISEIDRRIEGEEHRRIEIDGLHRRAGFGMLSAFHEPSFELGDAQFTLGCRLTEQLRISGCIDSFNRGANHCVFGRRGCVLGRGKRQTRHHQNQYQRQIERLLFHILLPGDRRASAPRPADGITETPQAEGDTPVTS